MLFSCCRLRGILIILVRGYMVQVFLKELRGFFTDKAVLQKSLYVFDSHVCPRASWKALTMGNAALPSKAGQKAKRTIKKFEAVSKPNIISEETKKQALFQGEDLAFSNLLKAWKTKQNIGVRPVINSTKVTPCLQWHLPPDLEIRSVLSKYRMEVPAWNFVFPSGFGN